MQTEPMHSMQLTHSKCLAGSLSLELKDQQGTTDPSTLHLDIRLLSIVTQLTVHGTHGEELQLHLPNSILAMLRVQVRMQHSPIPIRMVSQAEHLTGLIQGGIQTPFARRHHMVLISRRNQHGRQVASTMLLLDRVMIDIATILALVSSNLQATLQRMHLHQQPMVTIGWRKLHMVTILGSAELHLVVCVIQLCLPCLLCVVFLVITCVLRLLRTLLSFNILIEFGIGGGNAVHALSTDEFDPECLWPQSQPRFTSHQCLFRNFRQ